MQRTSKYTRFIILCTIFTFLSAAALGVLFAFIQVIMLGVLLLTFWFNPLSIIAQYFFVKKRVENYSNREFSDMEWVLVKLDIILAQLAGVTMAYPLALSINKAFFLGMFGGIEIFCVGFGMGATYGDIEVEFDTKTFEIKKITMMISYKWEGQRGLIPAGLT